ncbi:EF-hand [Ramicandelaber brevisporus]|nr:EF-hand [Ramicandelaber brevisporus]
MSYNRPQQQQQQQYGSYYPPQGPNLAYLFQSVDTDRSGRISAEELQRALVNADGTQFSFDTVSMLMSLFDRDSSGLIDFNEFQGIYRYIEDWKKPFHAFDQDRSGTIDKGELMTALRQFGLNVQPAFVDLAIKKLSNKQGSSKVGLYQPQQQTINFDGFIFICVFVNKLTQEFRKLDDDNDGVVRMGYHQFLELSLKIR